MAFKQKQNAGKRSLFMFLRGFFSNWDVL